MSERQPTFTQARAKLCIASLDTPSLQVAAQYNPKELQIDKSLSWEEHKGRDNQAEKPNDDSEQDDLKFKAGPPRSMTIELLFDGYEEHQSVEPDVIALETLASVQNPEAPASQQHKRRPHHCVIAWGASRSGMRPFLCVIESLAVKYTMWDSGGMPVRATCTIKVKECLKMSGSQAPPSNIGGNPPRQRKS
jgi:hypothetical protein